LIVNKENHPLRGILAGVAGGLVAAWVMNEFLAGPGKKLQRTVQTEEQNWLDDIQQYQAESGEPKEDAAVKVADKIVNVVTGGQHLSWEKKQKAGPIVHYAFGAVMGGVYGGLAECAPAVTAGLGTSFGGILFGTADLLAVPALGLSQHATKSEAARLASPFAAHLVYGATTEIVRRFIRAIL
jgi:putative membrane protein